MEVKGYVFKYRKVLFNTPHVPNMIALYLTVKNRDHVKIFLKQVTIKVMWSKIMLPPERSWCNCKEHTHLIWKPYVLWLEGYVQS